MAHVLILRTLGNPATLRIGSDEATLRTFAETLTAGIRWTDYRNFTVSQDFDGFQYRIVNIPDTFANPTIDADGDGIADVAAALGGIDAAPLGSYYGKSPTGGEGFNLLPLTNPAYPRIEPGTVMVSADGTTAWQHSGGTMYINNEAIDVPAVTGQTIPASLFSGTTTVYIYLKADGSYEYRETSPKASDPYDEVAIGLVVSTNGGSTFLVVSPIMVDKSPLTLALLLAFGGIRVLEGLEISKNTITQDFSQVSGYMVAVGRNPTADIPHIVPIAASNPITFALMTSDGTVTNFGTSSLPFASENVAGGSVINAIAGNNAGVWRIFQSSNGRLIALYPQTEHNSFNLALERASTEVWVRPVNLSGFAHVANIIIRGDTDTQTEFNNTNFVRVIPIDSGSAASGAGTELEEVLVTVTGANIGTNIGEVQPSTFYKRSSGNSVTIIGRFTFFDTDGAVTLTLPTGTFSEIISMQLTKNGVANLNSDITFYDTGLNTFVVDREDIIVGSSPVSLVIEGIV